MPHSEQVSVGVALPASAGTGLNDKRLVFSSYKEAYFTTAFVSPQVVSSGPIWCWLVIRTGGILRSLGVPEFISNDANFAGSNPFVWEGRVLLADEGGNELIPLLRNDTTVAATILVSGSIEVYP